MSMTPVMGELCRDSLSASSTYQVLGVLVPGGVAHHALRQQLLRHRHGVQALGELIRGQDVLQAHFQSTAYFSMERLAVLNGEGRKVT